MKRLLGHPFWQSVVVLAVSYVAFKYVIGYVLPALGVQSAPVPSSVIAQYMLTVVVGLLLYVSADEHRWRRFREPIHDTMVEPDRRPVRIAALVALPLLIAFLTYQSVKPSFAAPATLRSVHPAPPNRIDFRGRPIELTGLNNPLRTTGALEEHLRVGSAVYTRNCVPCHGDRLDGEGHFAQGLNPLPANFADVGTISQLTESYVFWRIAKGGPGLPPEGAPWHSAMPAWEDILTEDEIWATIIYLYERTGSTPRTWEEEGEEGH